MLFISLIKPILPDLELWSYTKEINLIVAIMTATLPGVWDIYSGLMQHKGLLTTDILVNLYIWKCKQSVSQVRYSDGR
jgi:hypothetical protein